MRFIPPRIHGIIDYLFSIVAIATPFALNFEPGMETLVFVSVGLFGIAYSLFTDYELGLVKRISMPAHLMLDCVVGAVLALSPWLFGFASRESLPHVIFGVAALLVVLVSRTRRPAARPLVLF